MSKKIRDYIVGDSAMFRRTFAEILCSDPRIELMVTALEPFVAAGNLIQEIFA